MSVEETAYFCAKCYARLPYAQTDEEHCPKCHAPICCEKDWLNEVQWGARVAEDWRLEREAIASGLITPPGVREGERVEKSGEAHGS